MAMLVESQVWCSFLICMPLYTLVAVVMLNLLRCTVATATQWLAVTSASSFRKIVCLSSSQDLLRLVIRLDSQFISYY
uniref:Putative secreted protein n=1 Tax=Anopheles darlingi TaxID=43151 RepID=A0A2M4DLL6_ANODA